MKNRILYIIFLMLPVISGCNDTITLQESGDTPTTTEVKGMYILCEGLFNMNNSSLSYYDFSKGEMSSFQDADKGGSNKTSYDYFKMKNGRKLGDTANDLQCYGSKLYCAVNVSSQIEVLNASTGVSVKQIPLSNENGVARQPRYFAFYKNKAYVCNYDGTVARIDTTTLTVDGIVKVGRNPDGICVANGKLYVANSGGLDETNLDNTVSVIDTKTFTETKKITVRKNLGSIHADDAGNVYVVSREAYNNATGDYDCKLHRIDSGTDELIKTYDLPVVNFTIYGHLAYMYSYSANKEAVQVMDTRTGEILDNDFIKDGTKITRTYNIKVNPENGDVYICDAQNYVINGSIVCFTKAGVHRFTIDAKGINPNSIAFINSNGSGQSSDPIETQTNSYVTKVLEYIPAPGQFVNVIPEYTSGDKAASMCAKCLEYFNKEYAVSLGAYGGYITVGFDHTIANVAGEYDIKVLGNAFDGSAEPGIVLVSADTNNDGLPNDEWYELKGSEYNNAATIHNYEITYYKPTNSTDNIRWTDNQNKEGNVLHNSYHTQAYYPQWISAGTMTFKGSRLPDNGVYNSAQSKWVMSSYSYGYADNQPNTSDGCKLKFDWAVDKNGNSVTVKGVDFIRIYSAVNQSLDYTVGEISTEVSGVADLHPTQKGESSILTKSH
ncbi:YncE family protein [uncultured Bacteroides sp.]|uniref:YncE family protein n=1 Tax=uncultured Bacteroides sp. TaxID=162156 RepID=UPI002AABEBFD|nr:YncE family protein [uncultured Bacteroides sp.]